MRMCYVPTYISNPWHCVKILLRHEWRMNYFSETYFWRLNYFIIQFEVLVLRDWICEWFECFLTYLLTILAYLLFNEALIFLHAWLQLPILFLHLFEYLPVPTPGYLYFLLKYISPTSGMTLNFFCIFFYLCRSLYLLVCHPAWDLLSQKARVR